MLEETKKSLYQLKLHETESFGSYEVTRVPGGWVYAKQAYGNDEISVSAVFVPMNSEFDPKQKSEPLKVKVH